MTDRYTLGSAPRNSAAKPGVSNHNLNTLGFVCILVALIACAGFGFHTINLIAQDASQSENGKLSSDQAMINWYAANRKDFQTIERLCTLDPRTEYVVEPPTDEQSWQAALHAVKTPLYIGGKRQEGGIKIEMPIWSKDVPIGHTAYKGYFYSKARPTGHLEATLDPLAEMSGKKLKLSKVEGTKYRELDSHWYLFYQYYAW